MVHHADNHGDSDDADDNNKKKKKVKNRTIKKYAKIIQLKYK